MSRWRHSGFGLDLESDFPLLPGDAGAPVGTPPSLTVRRGSFDAVASALSSPAELIWETSFDECGYEMQRGSAGDHRFAWGDRAAFHLSPAGDVLTCGFRDADDPGAMRLLLDTVLWSVSLIHGFELLHASAVCRGAATVAFVAGTGAGKTSLAAELIRRGAALLSDDVVALSSEDGRVLAYPGPPVMNVPFGSSRLLESGELGHTLASFDDEAWVRIASAVSTPRHLTAIFVLDRDEGHSTHIEPHPLAPVALLPHALGFPGTRTRLGTQFELVSDLIVEAPVLRLAADPSSTPAELANLVERELASSTAPAGVA